MTEPAEIPPLPGAAAQDNTAADLRFRYRLQLCKDGRARLVSHLEYINVLERAARRARIPLRYSQGFHPAPKFSFSDALPTGVASDAELIDLELFQSLDADRLMRTLNDQLPDGFAIVNCQPIDTKTPSPSACIDYATFRVELPEIPAELEQRLGSFLQSEQVPGEVLRKGKLIFEDLRPDVINLQLEDHTLLVSLRKGGPYRLLAWLLKSTDAAVRQLTVRKISVSLTPQPGDEQTNAINA